MYGMNGKQLRMIAAAEMARRNGQAFTGGVSIPLRPEMRLGYPVYIEHIDTCYYVTGITHSVVFGSSATTDLSLQFRRERIFEDGTSGLPNVKYGDVLKGCVMRNKEAEARKSIDELKVIWQQYKDTGKISEEQAKRLGINQSLQKNSPVFDSFMEDMFNEMEKDRILSVTNIQEKPGQLGYWKIDRAKSVKMSDSQVKSGTPDATTNNELVIMTDTSIPYTDIMGYRHIGALPYGANLSLIEGQGLLNMMDIVDVAKKAPMVQLNMVPPSTGEASGAPAISEDPKKAVNDFYDSFLNKVDYKTNFYSAPSSSTAVDNATKAQVESTITTESESPIDKLGLTKMDIDTPVKEIRSAPSRR
jgi:hypothetical protein